MEKIIVEITVPILGRTYDFELPAQKSGLETAEDIAAILLRLNEDLKFSTPALYDINNGQCLHTLQSLAELGIRDGSHLMLV